MTNYHYTNDFLVFFIKSAKVQRPATATKNKKIRKAYIPLSVLPIAYHD